MSPRSLSGMSPDGTAAGTAFLEEGIPAQSANTLEGPLVEVTGS